MTCTYLHRHYSPRGAQIPSPRPPKLPLSQRVLAFLEAKVLLIIPIAVAFAFLMLARQARAAITDGTNTFEHVDYATRMWSLSDPFAFSVISNLQTAVSSLQSSAVTGTYVTNTVNDLTGPRLSLLEGRTNHWNTAYGWGNHALAGYLTSYVETDPLFAAWRDTNTYVKVEADPTFSAWNATNQVKRLHDSDDPDYFQKLNTGTGTVWHVSLATNYVVYLSPDFLEVSGANNPGFTETNWPFISGSWSGYEVGGILYLVRNTESGFYAEWNTPFTSWPATLLPVNNAAGTAIVSQNVYNVTNILHRYATEARLESCYEIVSGEVAEVASDLSSFMATNVASLQPQTRTLYGNLAITNQAGYGSFAATNAAQASMVLAAASATTTNTALLQWPFSGQRVTSAECVTYGIIGVSSTVARATLWLVNAAGETVASNSVDAVRTDSTARPYWTNALAYAGAAITNGALRLTVTMGKTPSGIAASVVYTGGATPLTLQVTQAPLDYITPVEASAAYVRNNNGAATNLTVSGLVLTNGLIITGGWSNVYPTVKIQWGTTNINLVIKAPE